MNDHDSYNSVIITSQAGYDSVAVNVNKDFLSGGPWNHTRPLPVYQLGQEQNLTSLVQHLQNEAVANNLLQLEPTQCVDIFNPKYQSIYRNLLILTDGLYNPDNSVWTIIGYNARAQASQGWKVGGLNRRVRGRFRITSTALKLDHPKCPSTTARTRRIPHAG